MATGLYYPTNFINHDCGQGVNVKPETSGCVQELRAVRTVKKGEQLLFSYLPSEEKYESGEERFEFLKR